MGLLLKVLSAAGFSRDFLYKDSSQYVLLRYWKSEEARRAAYEDPEVQRCWAKLGNEIRIVKVFEVLEKVELSWTAMTTAGDVQAFHDASLNPPVRGFLHRPEHGVGDGLVLAHGAGSNSSSPLLKTVAGAFAAAGFIVLRCDLPYRQNRPFGPPRPGDAERDRDGLRNAVAAVRKLGCGRMFLGGHSYGGRQATMLCAAEPELVNGLLLLSYPLHPPRKPEQIRVKHLPQLQVPALFVQGTRDPFGSVEEMAAAIALIPAKTESLKVDGAGHDLGFKAKAMPEELVGGVVRAFQSFFGKTGS
jgi:uncharacterized protein